MLAYGGLYNMLRGSEEVTDIQSKWMTASAAGMRAAAAWNPLLSGIYEQSARHMSAAAVMLDRSFKELPKPEFKLDKTKIDGQTVKVKTDVETYSPFLDLIHFKRDTDRKDPPVIIFAPMSGHYATLLRDTVKKMLPHHEVIISDWQNPRNIPLSAGKFDVDDYTEHCEGVIEHVGRQYGQRPHVIAVCQPTIEVIAATALMCEDQNALRPASLTLMGGPLDVAAAHSEVSVFPTNKKAEFETYKNHAIQTVPDQFDGAGRSVYMAYAQLMCFISMNPERHAKTHVAIYDNLVKGTPESLEQAAKDMEFYDEYLAVMDMTEEFYIQTIERIFIDRELAKGQMFIGDRHVNLSKITDVPVFTIEGGLDDIAPVGQTSAIHRLLTHLPASAQFSHVEDEAGHYGIFAGTAWQNNIQPQIAFMIRETDAQRGITHSPAPKDALVQPKMARFVTPHAQKASMAKPVLAPTG